MVNSKTNYPLTSLYLYLTDQCNLTCSHCWISPGFSQQPQKGIPLNFLKKTISEAQSLGLQTVKLTGGEPLLYKELESLLAFLASKELTIYIETNGTLFNKKMLASFVSANVSQISVSLDAASEAVHDQIRGVKGSFQRVLKGMRLLSETGLNVQVIMTLQRNNSLEIQPLISLSKQLNAHSLKINNLLPCGRAQTAFQQKQNLKLEELIDLYRMVEEERRGAEGLEIIFDLPAAFRSIDDLKSRGINECNLLNIMGIIANGDFSICGIGQTIEELRMGNIYDDAISEVWTNNPLLHKLRRFLFEKLSGICQNCIFKFQCLGSCRANAYTLTKDLYAPFYLCQQYYDAGLFPSSRHIGNEKPYGIKR